MEFRNEEYGDNLIVDNEVEQDGEVGFTVSDGIYSTTSTYLNVDKVKELIKHLQSILEDYEK